MSHVVKQEKGFTIIELLISMSFVSVLLIVIVMTVIQVGNIYNKGLTMSSVEQAGQVISNDVRQTLSESEPFSVATAFRIQRYPGSAQDSPDGGRLCTGVYSYIWNFGKSLKTPINTYTPVAGASTDQIRFIRVRDSGGQYCADVQKTINESDATELLGSSSGNLAIQDFQISQLASDAAIGQALYRIVLEIGTDNQDSLTQLDSVDTSCKPPSDNTSLQEFCAVNKFDFTAEAGDKGAQ